MDYSWYYDQIKDATLEPLEVGQKLRAYYLRRWPGRRTMSTLIIFSPEGIVLTGDLRPAQRGCMTMEYGLSWFCSDLEPRYLAEKFLEKKWQPAKAFEWLENYIKDLRAIPNNMASDGTLIDNEPDEDDPGESTPNPYLADADRLSKLLDDLANFDSPEELYWALHGADCQTQSFDYEIVDGGIDYDDNEVGWLYAIQRRFAELMRPQLKSNPIEEGATNQ